MSGHVLTCRHCGRSFTARRSDAIGCSRSCRRHLAKAAGLAQGLPIGNPAATAALEGGWRRVGPYVIPPPDSRYTAFVDPAEMRRLP
jgi:hypothetical protein